jgi:arsenate reductase
MTARPWNVLFLCTGNSARSILAEAILSKDGGGRFRAFSAGSQPKGAIHPLALKVLRDQGYPVDGFRSKSWDEFTTADAPAMDFIVTVCDNAAGEVCPLWPGHPVTAHWGFADPAAVAGTSEMKREAFASTFKEISQRLRIFLNLPFEKLDHLSLQQRLKDMGLP